MVNETLEAEPLETLAERIAKCANEADERRIKAVQLIREARRRVEAGEAGEITWYVWARKNIDLSDSRLRELQCIAEADDPQKELERIRSKTRERVERHRERKRSAPLRNGGTPAGATAGLEEDRERLIEWAQRAPLAHVALALTYIQGLGPTPAAAEPDQAREPAVT